MNNNKHFHWKAFGYIIFVVIIFVACLTIASSPLLRSATGNFFRLSTTHQPERLTELYFTNPSNLPESYSAYGANQVLFTIHNNEDHPVTYRYRIYNATAPNESIIQTVTLSERSYRSVVGSVDHLPALDFGHQLEIIIELIDQKQTIDFWVSRAPE